MTAETLQYMVDSIPDWMLPEFFPGRRVPAGAADGSNIEVARFLLAYRDVAFGWKYASILARHKIFIPLDLPEDDHPVMEAHLHCWNPRKWSSPLMTRVLALTSPLMSQEAGVLRALLLTPRLNLAEIARRMSVDEDVVYFYDKLFFNVRDRFDDAMYLRALVYPENRLSRFVTGYRMDMMDGARLLAQSAYDNDPDSVMFLAGLSRQDDIPTGDVARTSFEDSIMATAAVLVKNGWMDQAQGHTAITLAKQLLSADKLSGNDDSGDQGPGSAIGEVLLDELRRVRLADVKERAQELFMAEATH